MIHVLPIDDTARHEPSDKCQCSPDVEWKDPKTGKIHSKGPIVTHNCSPNIKSRWQALEVVKRSDLEG